MHDTHGSTSPDDHPTPGRADQSAQPVEAVLTAAWAQVLDVEHVAPDDNFFALGGNSIKAVQIAGLVARAGLRVSVRQIFGSATIRQLAGLVDSPDAAASGATDTIRSCKPMGQADQAAQVLPLTPVQSGILYQCLDATESGVYVVQQVDRLRGAVDPDLLRRAWELILHRHPVLRTSLRWGSAETPQQVVHLQVDLPFEVVDLQALDAVGQRAAMSAHREADLARGFDLRQPPLMRVTLFTLGPLDHHMLWTIHHLVIDEWSVETLMSELSAVLLALRDGEAPQLPPAAPFSDYVEWWRAQDPAAAEEFWREALDGLEQATELGASTTSVDTERRGFQAAVGSDLTTAVLRFAARHNLTLNTVVQGAFAVLLSRSARQDDVCLYVVSAGRPPEIPGVQDIVGNLVATTPLRAQICPQTDVLSWLAQLQDFGARAREHEFIGLSRIQGVGPLGAGRSLSDVLLLFQNLPRSNQEMFEREAVWEKTDFPLTLTLTPSPATELAVAYDPSRFDAHRVRDLVDQFRFVLGELIDSPTRPVGDLKLLSAEQERELLVDWSTESDAVPPPEATMSELIEEQAHRRPDAIALVDEDFELTYGQLNSRANRLAAQLRAQGVQHEERVAVCLPRSAEMVVAVLAILKVGAAYVPIDPATPDDRVRFMVADATARIVLTDADQTLRWRQLTEQVVSLPAEVDPDAGDAEDQDATQIAGPRSLAYVIYTSGSTGQPKGVMVEHHSLTNYAAAAAAAYEMTSEDRVLQFMALSFDWSHDEIFVPLSLGATIALRTDAMAESVEDYLAGCRRLGITISNLPSAFWHVVAQAVTTGGQQLPPTLRIVSIGGESANPDLVASWVQAHPRIRLLNGYGPTEATCGSTLCDLSVTPVGRGGVPIGRPLANVRVHVLDCAGRPTPVGVVGELYIGGEGVARGYLNRDDLSAAVFLDDPFTPGTRRYKTGDLCRYRSDRQIEFVGRADDQTKIRGYRIEPGEIESVIISHPKVRQCAVVVHENAIGDKRLIAHVETTDVSPTNTELSSHAAHWLPEYMVPAMFVIHEALPLTRNGKIDRRALLGSTLEEARLDDSSPTTQLESSLAEVWSQVLGIAQVGPDDDFFDLGGDSISSLRVVSLCREVGVAITTRQLFAHPTVRELGAHLAALEGHDATGRSADSEARALVDAGSRSRAGVGRGGVVDVYPCSPVQVGMLFHSLYDNASTAYVNQTVIELPDTIDLHALLDAWRSVVSRHDVLRTSFVWDGFDKPLQVLHEAVDLPFEVVADRVDLSRHLEDDRARGFDLAAAPLLRLTVVRDLQGDRHLICTWHHTILDGWSGDIVTNEVEATYQALRTSTTVNLPPSPAYRDYIAWLDRHGQAESETFWREHLAGLTAPSYVGEPGDGRGRHAMVSLSMPAHVTTDLTTFARAHRLTTNTVLQGALALLVAGYTGTRDVCFGVVSAGRPADISGIDHMVGLFLTTTPLRLTLDPDLTLLQTLVRLQASQATARQHEHASLSAIQGWGPLGTGTSLFDTVLAVQNYRPGAPASSSALDAREQSLGHNSYALSLHVEFGEALTFDIDYNCDRWSEENIHLMFRHLQRIVRTILTAPDGPLADLVLPSPPRTGPAAPMGPALPPAAAAGNAPRLCDAAQP